LDRQTASSSSSSSYSKSVIKIIRVHQSVQRMATMLLYWNWQPMTCLLVILLATLTDGFNLDLRTKLIHRGDRKSMFGYDVAMFKNSANGQAGLLIGAPKAESGQPGVRRGGAVFRCETKDQRCTKIFFDTAGHARALNGSVLLQIDSKSDQWFGATVVSSKKGDSVLACAPRYTYFYSTFDRKEPVGTCYLAQDNFSSFREYAPCRIETRWGYHRLGSCMAGFSAAISDQENKLYIGAPGAWYWQGSLVMQEIGRDDMVKRTSEGPAYLDDTYMGYSMAVGDFKGNSDNHVAVGVPKGNFLTGMVVLFDSNLKVLQNITGHQVGSYFGAALAVGDFNDDGLDDIAIGAPLFIGMENKQLDKSQTEGKYEVGAVYVYFQDRQHHFVKYTTLVGLKEWSRFGHDVAAVGDLNGDSFDDIVIGAPYDGEDRKGAVYVYHGMKDGIKEKFSQVIYARDIDPSLRTFGWSVTGGVDIDNNDYPDVLVGAYSSDRSVLFRTRPVVSVSGFVKILSIWKISFVGFFEQKMLHDFRIIVSLDPKKGISSRARFLESHSVTQLTLDSVPIRKGERWCERRYVYVLDDIRDKLNPITVQVNYSIVDEGYMERQLRPVMDAYIPSMISGEINIQKDCGKDNICIPDLQMTAKLNRESILIGADDRFNVSVVIHNALEDAFEAQFFIVAPVGLDYEGFTRQMPSRPITCSQPKELNNGKNYVIACDVGNPLPKSSTVRFSMQFSTENLDLVMGGISLNLTTNSTNNETERTLVDNEVLLVIPMEVKADFIVTGVSRNESYHYDFNDRRDDFVFDSDAGPVVSHVYEIRNLGPSTLSEMSVDVYWPSYFVDNAKPLLYLIDDIETEGKITCELLQKGHINSEGLIIVPRPEDAIERVFRVKRQEKANSRQRYEEKSDVLKALRNAMALMKQSLGDFGNAFGQMRNVLQRVRLNCMEMACSQWQCKIKDFKKDERVLLKVDSRLWLNTLIDEVFYDAMISSLVIAEVTKLPYRHPTIELPLRYAVASTIVNPKDPTRVSRGVPTWLIFVAILAGLTSLILLIMLLWKFGFFKRKRPPRGQALLSKPPEPEYYGYSSYSSAQTPGGYTTYGNPHYEQTLYHLTAPTKVQSSCRACMHVLMYYMSICMFAYDH
ncbi:Integrin alpha pat-2, partial [Trichinella sp. T8]